MKIKKWLIYSLVFVFLLLPTLILIGCNNTENFVITFVPNGGMLKTEPQIQVTSGDLILRPIEPTKDGYNFLGWTRDDAQFDFPAIVLESKTLVAQWERIDATVETVFITLIANQGTLTSESVLTYAAGTLVYAPTNPTRNGFEFVGWFHNGVLFQFPSQITIDIILVAQWQEVITNFTVTFNANGGALQSAESVEVIPGDLLNVPVPAIREGFVFSGWLLNGMPFNFATPIGGNFTLVASWVIETFLVTFDSDGGSRVNSQFVSFGGLIIPPANPTKTDYNFVYWLRDGQPFNLNDKIAADVHLIARWELKTVNITFDSNGGSAIENQVIDIHSNILKPPQPTKDDYIFIGWTFGRNAFDFASIVSTDIILVAHWQVIEVTINFDANGGELQDIATLTVPINELVIAPKPPVRQGYVFMGWVNNGSHRPFPTIFRSDMTLFAVWQCADDEFLFRALNNIVTITGFIGTSSKLMIPESINDMPVRHIADNAFLNQGGITSIILPSGIQTIGNNSFNGATQLTSVTLSDGLQRIGDGVFQNTRLAEIIIPITVTHIGSDAFMGVTTLTSVDLNEGLAYIGNSAFMGTRLVEITIPSTVKNIDMWAFRGIPTLTSVTFNEGLEGIGLGAFEGTSLVEIAIPASVHVIHNSAFRNVETLVRAEFVGYSAPNIGHYAFWNTLLAEVTFFLQPPWRDRWLPERSFPLETNIILIDYRWW